MANRRFVFAPLKTTSASPLFSSMFSCMDEHVYLCHRGNQALLLCVADESDEAVMMASVPPGAVHGSQFVNWDAVGKPMWGVLY
jgi:hypothetical protein